VLFVVFLDNAVTAQGSCREEDFGCSEIDLVNSIENGASDLIETRATWVSKYSLDTHATRDESVLQSRSIFLLPSLENQRATAENLS